MSSSAIATMTKMMKSLPESAQSQVVAHLREYIEYLVDELEWDMLIEQTRPKLIEAARRARQEVADGLAQPLDLEQL